MTRFHPSRPDDPIAVEFHRDRYYGGKALVVLGGPSGKNWEQLRDDIQPDVILTANGATKLPGADYWILVENMNYCYGHRESDAWLSDFLHVFDKDNTAPNKFISHRSWNLLPNYGIDPDMCVCIRRWGYGADDGGEPQDFSFREYGPGFLGGPISKSKGWKPKVKVRVGTAGLQLLHLAGILGCAEVHTIGYDLMFKGKKHHWYKHPEYKSGKFRHQEMFIEHKGAQTQDWWVETAQYYPTIEHLFERDGLSWKDHSDGLLKLEGVWCTKN